ncbi:competence protein ComK [Planococcus beigongshangi]|uniref:competence protein ComK n=1 Tax=Planococcus beigongshangi TaxID=2782536 RepID=UPI00193C695E|nr:competence protein ComK [Planococcus beigongshangi]
MGRKIYNPFSYTISNSTYALIPHIDGTRLLTRVIEDRSEFLIEQTAYKTITGSCSFYRGSLVSATLYAQKAIGVKHKPPIIVGEYYGNPLIFFPTHSPKNKESVWFNYDAIDLIESDERGGCVVYLSNGQTVALDVSAIALRNQHSFAGSLRRYFKKAQNQHKQQLTYITKRPMPVRPRHPSD